MTELVSPDIRLRASRAVAVREYDADGTTMHGSGLWDWDSGGLSEASLVRELDRLRAQADPATVLRPDWVHCSYFWIVEDEEFLGYLAIRHRLNNFLLDKAATSVTACGPPGAAKALRGGRCCWRWPSRAGSGSTGRW